MLKLVGALLLVIASSAIGISISNRFAKRPKHIRQLQSALQLLEAEITYSQTPLQLAFMRIAVQLPDPIKEFFQVLSEQMNKEADFFSLWNQQVEELASSASFKKNEIEILKQFGNSLGRHDLIHQQKQIRLALTHLHRELEEAREEHSKYTKLAKSLGVLVGVFLALLLI